MNTNDVFENLYSRRAKYIPSTPDEPEIPNLIDFSFGQPDPSYFPVEQLRSAAELTFNLSPYTALQYSIFRGSETLIFALINYLSSRVNVPIEFQNIIITNGSMQVLSMVGRVFLDPGDIILTEAPTYFRAVTIFRGYEAQIEDVPVDEAGLRIDRLKLTLTRLNNLGKFPKLLYTMPTYQNPSGATMPYEHRMELLNLSERYGFLIVEDTAYNELWYDNPPPPSLYELSKGEGKVIQMGTFSKLMAPGLGIGWALGAKPLITRFVEFKENGGTAPLTAHIAAEFLQRKEFEHHVENIRHIYKQKRDTIIKSLENALDGLLEWDIPRGGYFVWLRCRQSLNIDSLMENALREKVSFLPGKYCYASNQHCLDPFIRLAFSALSPESIREGINRLTVAMWKTI